MVSEMENASTELDQPINVCLYTAIPQEEQFKRRRYPVRERLKGIARNSFNEFRTILTGDLHFDPYSYMVANALGDNSNRGDIAIRIAIQSQLRSAFAPRRVQFFDVAWGKLTVQNIDTINRQANLFVIAGGGYIFVNGDGTPGAMLSDAPTLDALNCPIVACGIGVNRNMHETLCPLSNLPRDTQNLVKHLSRACSKIGVRDQVTAELFGRYGDRPASVVGDPVLHFSKLDGPGINAPGRLRVGVNLAAHGWRAYAVLEPILPQIVALLRHVQKVHGAEISYFLHHDFERPVVKYLQKIGLGMRVVDGEAVELIQAYEGVDFVVNQMLHSCIFSANAGVPFLNLAYDTKNLAFCSLLDIPECVIEHSQVTEERLVEKFDGLVNSRGELSKKILEKKMLLGAEYRSFLNGVTTLAAEKQHG